MDRQGKLEIEEVLVQRGSAISDKTLEASRLRQESGVIVLAIKGEDAEMHFNPAPNDVIHSGDHLIVMGNLQGLQHLERLASERA